MSKKNECIVIQPDMSYYIVEKDKGLVNKIKEALSNSKYKCLGVSTVFENLELKFEDLPISPDIVFVGNVINYEGVIDMISRKHSKSTIMRIYSKSKMSKSKSTFYENNRLLGFLVL
ncbi:hypothetical protein ACFSKL_22210 [Belliella marina]|uniref:Uncharacterized protein n=1 Tax=Belliella marina TaxID=1644146 RepID=A0ABW4VS62_9BACT